MNARKILIAGAVALCALTTAPEALAGQFGVSPLRLELGNSVRDTELTLTNQSDRALNVQARVMRWTQDATGRDVTETASELVIFPRITEIAAGESRAIRIAMRGGPVPGESAYRVFVEELPMQAAADAPVQFTLQVSVPLFVRNGPAERAFEIGDARIEGGNLLVDLSNTGSTFCRLGQIEAVGVDASGSETFRREIPGWYLLTGTSRTFAAELDPTECDSTTSIRVLAQEETMEIEKTVTITSASCEATRVASGS